MLEVLCVSRLRRKVLLDFARNDGRETGVAALAARIKEDPGNLSRELKALAAAGFLRVSEVGRSKNYRVSGRAEAQKLLDFLKGC